jgi:integrase
MASVFKRPGRNAHDIKFKDQHGQWRWTSGFSDRRATEALAAKIEHDAERLAAGLPPDYRDVTARHLGLDEPAGHAPAPGIEEVLGLYLADLQRQQAAEATIRHRRDKLSTLLRRCGWKTLADVTAEAITRHLAGLSEAGCAASTTNAYRDVLHTFLAWCESQRYAQGNAAQSVKHADVRGPGPYRRRAFTAAELHQLLDASPRRSALYLAAALSGFRKKEIHLLERRDADLEAALWHVRPEVDKNRRAWIIPVLPDLLPTVRRLCEGLAPRDRLFPRKPGQDRLNEDLRRAGIVKVTPDGRRVNFHSLRYTFCTLLARVLPIQEVKVFMRHLTLKRTADLYLDLGIQDLRQAVAKLPSIFPTHGVRGDTFGDTGKQP